MLRRTGRLLGIELDIVDKRYPLVKRWTRPVDERMAMHPTLDEPIVAEFNKGTFLMCNERYPSIERLTDQYFPGLMPRTKDDFEALASKTESMTVEELMLESIGCWNATLLTREYSGQYYTGAKLATPMQWEVAGIQDYLPKYYKAWRQTAMYFARRLFSFYDSEMIIASPKYKVGGVVPQIMHVNELHYRKFVILYPVCHNDFQVYPESGEERYALEPLDYLLYSHLNYYHVLMNMYAHPLPRPPIPECLQTPPPPSGTNTCSCKRASSTPLTLSPLRL